LKRLQPILDALESVAGTRPRLWIERDGELRLGAGADPGWTPPMPPGPGLVVTPQGPRWLSPMPESDGLWIEGDVTGDAPAPGALALLQLLEHFSRCEREAVRISQELATRYEEIDLLYTISEILGQTLRLEEAAQTIVRAVSSVVGARRASIVVFDERIGALRTVASQGLPPGRSGIIPPDDPASIAARVFREGRALIGDPIDGVMVSPGHQERGYQGVAFMSVPICYAAPGAAPRCVGVVNLTDRIGGDRFSPTDRKLVVAVANQIGAAIENARLVEREREQHRLQQELLLAHHLQQNLLPDPSVLQGDAQVAVRCISVESVGGDFYTFSRLGLGLVGVMVGDVSSHGFSAALVMALVLSAAGIHAATSVHPEATLAALRDSLAGKLTSTDTYLTVFYGVLDPVHARLTYANAGHPHAFRVPRSGAPERLDATAPPLGLSATEDVGARAIPWVKEQDLLCLWTDGLADATSPLGERFGEARILEAIASRRNQEPEAILAAVMGEADEFSPEPADDRTLLVMKL